MYGALLTTPERPDSDAGVLFMHNEGYSTMCGHGIIAVATIALERALITPRVGGQIVFDTPAGQVRAVATLDTGGGRTQVARVAFTNVPSFVLHPAVPIRIGSKDVRVDVAFGGAFYAVVDAEAVGLGVRREDLGELRKAGMAIKAAVESAVRVAHPEETGLQGIYGTIFTGPPTAEDAHLRNVTIFADAEVDRSPCGTGTCAVMAVLAAMGLLGPDDLFVHESIIGTRFRGRRVGDVLVGEHPAIVPEVEGEATITGEHSFLIAETDPLRYGFRL
jgi:proline racemase